jgi:signal transduction histidine kinase
MENAPEISVHESSRPPVGSDALLELSSRLAAPASVLLSFAPRLVAAITRGDSTTLLISADVIERNAENLSTEVARWEERARGGEESNPETEELTLLVHEVRTPITIVHGCAATLKRALDHLDRDNLLKMANAVERSVLRLNELIASFRDAEGFVGDPRELNTESVELGAFASQVVRELEPLTHPHPVSVLVVDEVRVMADAVRLRQVLTNLIGNAVKFTASNTPIRVTVERVDDNASLSVLDRGSGIPESRREEVFERFARLDRSVPGAGLGLWVSRAIARAHGGELAAMASPEGGSCFVLSLPAES